MTWKPKPWTKERFLSQLISIGDPNVCWEWSRWRNRDGYGMIQLTNTEPGRKRRQRSVFTHRMAFELFKGPIPPDKYVLHRCGNPACCNPGHLYVGDQFDNMRDCKNHGRFAQPKGSAHPHAVITEDIVREIRSLYAAGGSTQKELAQRFGISKNIVYQAVRRLTWKHVD